VWSALQSPSNRRATSSRMERHMASKLQQGDHFPPLTFKLVSGGTITIPDDLPDRYAAVLFYRGHW